MKLSSLVKALLLLVSVTGLALTAAAKNHGGGGWDPTLFGLVAPITAPAVR